MRILLAPGAGAPSSSAWMRGWAARLAALGEVETFDWPYQLAGKKAPDRLPVLMDALRARLGDTPAVVVGKSMGGRVAVNVAVSGGPQLLGIVALGYPLAGNPKTRLDPLLTLDVPILFVQGTRDALCPLDALADARARMRRPGELLVIPSGDHGLQITRTRAKDEGLTQDDVDAGICDAIGAFLSSACASVPPA